ncbi:MAG TPA: hypothetical protein VFP87_05095, partial [Chitinophagaceae bacterium]|nr:hypothetical protein [Chitinophagaceae bacterium]
MGNNISKLIAEKKGYAILLDQLGKLGGSELNSLLLEVFREKANKLEPTELLKLFENNRFVLPS